MVISSFNCEGWDTQVIENMMFELSKDHSQKIILCLQETWRYEVPRAFEKRMKDKYDFIHISSMDSSLPRSRGRPFGGICMIISKDIDYELHYSDTRCQSIILLEHRTLVTNVYLPYDNARISADENTENYTQAVSHLIASHHLADDILCSITVGDVNCAPTDLSDRAEIWAQFLNDHNYEDADLLFYDENVFTHNRSGRLIDRLVISANPTIASVEKVEVNMKFVSSDHFPLVAEVSLQKIASKPPEALSPPRLNWKKASVRALDSYNNLANKLCANSLVKFYTGTIDGPVLYTETVNNLATAAEKCIPKFKKNENRPNHNIPMWRERMSTFQANVDFWLQSQFLQGGPSRCHPYIRQQLRIARAQYKRQHRALRREIRGSISDCTTRQNCHKVLFGKRKAPQPSIIDGHTREGQPMMWREFYKESYNAEETPYSGDLLDGIDNKLLTQQIDFSLFNLNELNDAVNLMNTNKSYKMHYHWKSLNAFDHCAKVCLIETFNEWANDALMNKPKKLWTLFDTNLSPIPKNGKRNLTQKKSWRPISLGTSENWILEKVFLARLRPFSDVSDSQFGYKEKHSTSHAIELVRVLERSSDCHVCMLDASSAFDKLSWCRIRDQLIKRNVPLSLTKLCLLQLSSNRISVCGTDFIYPRLGIKQGGVLSGRYFSMCYDDLVYMLRKTGSGVLFLSLNNKRILIQIIVYADDILLISKSPSGLASLIDCTLTFSQLYGDVTFNPSKSVILRLGTDRKPPVSVRNIPVADTCEYLGTMIGRAADPQRNAATKLYTKANIMLKENKELIQCSNEVKNLAVECYGNVYALENFLNVGPKLRQAHRYLTQAAHSDWRTHADLPGPNIRSRRLYTVYNLDSLEVLHRRRRNNFLIKAESSNNLIIKGVIGSLPRITV